MPSTAKKVSPIIPRDNVIQFPGNNPGARRVVVPRGWHAQRWGTLEYQGGEIPSHGVIKGDVLIFDQSRLRPEPTDLCVFRMRTRFLRISTYEDRKKWSQLLGVVVGFQRFIQEAP